MTHLLIEPYLEERVLVVTNDGRVMVGVLKGFDQTTNVVLDKCHERVYHGYHEPAEDVPLGLYIIRGDNLAMIGKLNEERDKQTDISTVCAPPLHPVRF